MFVQIINGMLLFLYLISLYFTGRKILTIFVGSFSRVFMFVSEWVIGVSVGVPITYFLSILFVRTGEQLLWGTVSYTFIIIGIAIFHRYFSTTRSPRGSTHIYSQNTYHDVGIVLFALCISIWLMNKTFHGVGELVFVGSNTVFDFGHALGLIRSMSWGNNIPVQSPFQSGSPFFYHYFFYFFIAIWEYFGIPIGWAVNIPSVLSFTALILIIFYLPQILISKNPFTGWLAVLLTVTNSSLTFWHLLFRQGFTADFLRSIWRMPNYPFAGPFDGSVISIYMTLNNYMNQRHLAFSIALGLLIYIFISSELQKKSSNARVFEFAGILTGLLMLWNIAICMVTAVLLALLLIIHKKWKQVIVYGACAIITMIVINIPNISNFFVTFNYIFAREVVTTAASKGPTATWRLLEYLWENLGILPAISFAGFLLLTAKIKKVFLPFVVLFTLICTVAGVAHRGFDQKYLSFLIIGVNILSAYLLIKFWESERFIKRVAVIICVFILFISGIVDLFPIKNEFAFPFINDKTAPVIAWIREHTDKQDVLLSYPDIIDPVVLAGRKNYAGFFGNIGWQDRSQYVRVIYSGDIALAKRFGVRYILLPQNKKPDFAFTAQESTLTTKQPVVYKDSEFVIVATSLN